VLGMLKHIKLLTMSDKRSYITVFVNKKTVKIIIGKKNIQFIHYISIYPILYRLILHLIIFNLLKSRTSYFNIFF